MAASGGGRGTQDESKRQIIFSERGTNGIRPSPLSLQPTLTVTWSASSAAKENNVHHGSHGRALVASLYKVGGGPITD